MSPPQIRRENAAPPRQWPSDGARRNHLLPQVILVLRYCAIPRLDSLIFAHQYLFRNLVQQSVIRSQHQLEWEFSMGRGHGILPEVVADDHHAAAESVDRVCETVNRRDI